MTPERLRSSNRTNQQPRQISKGRKRNHAGRSFNDVPVVYTNAFPKRSGAKAIRSEEEQTRIKQSAHNKEAARSVQPLAF
jgi:hypothetical protein